ncbi:hypothetical protein [Rubritalea tangerina]
MLSFNCTSHSDRVRGVLLWRLACFRQVGDTIRQLGRLRWNGG